MNALVLRAQILAGDEREPFMCFVRDAFARSHHSVTHRACRFVGQGGCGVDDAGDGLLCERKVVVHAVAGTAPKPRRTRKKAG